MKKSLWNDIRMSGKGILEIAKYSPMFILISCLYAIFQSGQPFISIYFSARIIDGILARASVRELMGYVLWMVALDCICTIIMKVMDGRIFIATEMLFFLQRLARAEKLHRVDYETVEDAEFQSKKEKIESTETIMGFGLTTIASILPMLLKHGCTILWSVALTVRLFFSVGYGESGWKMWVCSPVFSVILACMILVSVCINMKLVSKSTSKSFELYEGLEWMISIRSYYAYRYIGNYHIGKDIRIYNQKPMLMKELKGMCGKTRSLYQQLAETVSKYGSISSAISVCISGLVYLFVGLKALAGMFGVGSIMQYVGSINQFVSGVTDFMKEFTSLRENNEALGYYFDYMAVPECRMEEGISIEEEPKEIVFHNVSFKYPGTEDYVLKDLSVKFETGKKTAIVGMNGSGKTTLIKLLCRLFRPTEGTITLNGIDIQEYKYADYLKLISVVFQDFKLFGYTLGENVAASAESEEGRIKEALSKAGFGERLASLEKGTGTYLYKEYDENGVEISGGEAQKIAISRALYKDASIVILDEPTAALDPLSEYEIYSRFHELVADKTAIFISHRLSSCRFCDEIVVMDSGKMVQTGNHETLVADEDGKYYELWNAQAQYYKDEVSNEEENETVSAGVACLYQ